MSRRAFCLSVRARIGHAFAQAMGHEPRRLVGDAKGALKLKGRDAFLAGAHQVGREKPLVQRDFGTLEHGSNGRGELLAAFLRVALIHARTVRLAVQRRGVANETAMRTDRAMRPTRALKMLAGLVGVGEDWIGQVHSGAPV